MALPLATACRKHFPESEVHFLVTPDAAGLLKNHPHVDRTWTFDKNGKEKGWPALLRLQALLKKESFDLALVPHRSFRTGVLLKGASIPERIGFGKGGGRLFLTRRVPYSESIHEVERNIDLIRGLGIPAGASPPVLFPGREEKMRIDRFLLAHHLKTARKLLALAPGSAWPTKRWPLYGFLEVAAQMHHRYGIKSFVIGGPAEREMGLRMERDLPDAVVSAAGTFSLLESAELIRRCRVLVSNDSAPAHMAAAVRVPVISLFGPTVPELGFYPFGGNHTILQKRLSCRPCGVHGGNRCPLRHFRCMRDIHPGEVIAALKRVIE
ncbi:glycosyltransferase family 9 protein [bacterium]|nr:glycosyltransferase family 9 protein [bacterium]